MRLPWSGNSRIAARGLPSHTCVPLRAGGGGSGTQGEWASGSNKLRKWVA